MSDNVSFCCAFVHILSVYVCVLALGVIKDDDDDDDDDSKIKSDLLKTSE